ncbi:MULTISPECIES: permease-like cell division protein FtsX [Eubacterium]|uniref:Cell division protein FtsX n=1 Tax=Eubacterium ruminantium TaxID=42322 RepID=A0A1T4L5H5_9FIRM|nr:MULTISPECIES: permease-like cell division protein FtsX [Eubacterium]MCR5368176.1 permease-like cell division protein FtsX [Eubacterium sp.]SCW43382.1 cell division transport system permease protein [Eubacterium ruminantium]SDM80362.1 cell division transport system permease protein [Eubacterium ruminantium]SJZ49801.1 cell division transport system permease protein [Eubacterium ruminantium]
MRISSLWYSFRQGVKNIRRNLLFSLASIGTIVSCLFLFGLFYAVVVNFKSAMKSLENSISISVFFDEDANIELLQSQIRTRSEVDTFDYISAEEAWIKYSNDTYDNPEEARAAFGDDNPLAKSASFSITLKDVSKQAEFVRFLEGLNGVRKVKSSQGTADTISSINLFVGYASIGIILILLLVSIFLISNTITIGITVRKEEIKIMKLIGATNFFVRAPFIVEGVIIGLVGSVIPLVLIYYAYDTVLKYVVGRLTLIKKLFEFVSLHDLFKVLVPATLLIGVGIGLLGSIFTTKKHLKI